MQYLRSQEEIKGLLGADGLLYQTHADLIAVGHELNPAISQFEDSCFTGAGCRIKRIGGVGQRRMLASVLLLSGYSSQAAAEPLRSYACERCNVLMLRRPEDDRIRLHML